MVLNDYVFVMPSTVCDKLCPYCIARMAKAKTDEIDLEIAKLRDNLSVMQKSKKRFKHFVLSGNGEPSLYDTKILEEIKSIVEESGIFDQYRIQTSGNLFFDEVKLKLFENWVKEITVMSDIEEEDREFYSYKRNYLQNANFLNCKKVRVNIVLLKSNIERLNILINHYLSLDCVETIALKILDNICNLSNESIWISKNAISYSEIDNIIKVVSVDNKLFDYNHKRFYFLGKNKKLITLHYDPANEYDYINLESKKSIWHTKAIKKGVYGEFSKVLEEVEEAQDALKQNNQLMYLIELSDILGAIEGIANKHNLSLNDLKTFSDKVKEQKKDE